MHAHEGGYLFIVSTLAVPKLCRSPGLHSIASPRLFIYTAPLLRSTLASAVAIKTKQCLYPLADQKILD